MKYIYILLTRSNSIPSKIIGKFTSGSFTHASIAFEDSIPVMYSFARKYQIAPFPAGLVEEHIDLGFYKSQGNIPCALLRIAVDEKTYDKAKRKVNDMLLRKSEFHYSLLGVIFCKMHIALSFPKYYFCSQFVGEVLSYSGAAVLPKKASLMRPSDFFDMDCTTCVYYGGLIQLAMMRNNPELLSKPIDIPT